MTASNKLTKKETEILDDLEAWLECNIEMDTPIHFDNIGKVSSLQALPVFQKLRKLGADK